MAIDINDLLLFAQIIEASSFTTAADFLNIPKSTLSRRISKLEQQLGERLLVRNTRHISITEFGQAILEHVRIINREASAIADLANSRQITPSGLLRISMPPDFIDLVNKDFFYHFIENYRQIKLDLDFSSRRVDILAERYDLAIRMATKLPDDTTLVARPINILSGGLYASPLYLDKYGLPKTPQDLESHIGIYLADSAGDPQQWYLETSSDSWHGSPQGTVMANSVNMIKLLATQGIGIISIISNLVTECLAEGSLIRILADWQTPNITMWAITPGRKLLPLKTQVFLKELKKALIA